jgi:hypothetical protein
MCSEHKMPGSGGLFQEVVIYDEGLSAEQQRHDGPGVAEENQQRQIRICIFRTDTPRSAR